jgi:hypothetical protein
MPKIQLKELTKDEITQAALSELRANGARVRKVYNGGFFAGRKRRNQVQPGWSDIPGYSRTGVHMECEVKTVNDKFSQDQIDRLNDLDECGGIALVAIQVGLTVEVIPWKQYKARYF